MVDPAAVVPALARPDLVLPVAMADRVFRLAADLMAASVRGSEWVRPRATWGPASGLREVRLGSVLRVPTNSPATRLPMPTDGPVVKWEAVKWEAGVGVDRVAVDRLVANARSRLNPANNSRRTM